MTHGRVQKGGEHEDDPHLLQHLPHRDWREVNANPERLKDVSTPTF
jgi:hypothetical protein